MRATAISPAEARRAVLAAVVPTGAEEVPLAECAGRVAATAVRSRIDVQPFDNSAMDGFAVRAADASAGRRLRVAGESRAGRPADAGPGEGEAVRISTGAQLPPGADAVVPVEDAVEEDGHVVVSQPVEPGRHVRRAGEDVAAGEVLVAAGSRLGASEIAVLAAGGAAAVACARRPTVAVLSSGDELVAPGEPLGPGQIHDTNRLALCAQAREAGAEVSHAGWLPDSLDPAREAIAGALGCDAVIVAGGVSVGRHDHVKAALAELGVEERFWRVAMRPGGPTWFGVAEREDRRPTLVFGLPGNPVSAMVTFHLYARPALRAATGLDPLPPTTRAALAGGYRKAPGKVHYLRCRLTLTEQGWRAALTRRRQGSHVLSSMLGADALAVIPAEAEEVRPGGLVEVEPLR